LKESNGDTPEKISVDETEGKLFLLMRNVAEKGKKPQEIARALFGLENPVFLMTREQILLENQAKGLMS